MGARALQPDPPAPQLAVLALWVTSCVTSGVGWHKCVRPSVRSQFPHLYNGGT